MGLKSFEFSRGTASRWNRPDRRARLSWSARRDTASRPAATGTAARMPGGSIGRVAALHRRSAAATPPEIRLGGDGEQLDRRRWRCRARRGEEHPLAVRRPAHRDVRPGMPSQALGHAARGRHHEDVDIAVVLAGERDLDPSGEKTGLFPRPDRSQPAGLAALARHAPEVAGVGEDDLCRAQRGRAKQQVRGLGKAGSSQQKRDKSGDA